MVDEGAEGDTVGPARGEVLDADTLKRESKVNNQEKGGKKGKFKEKHFQNEMLMQRLNDSDFKTT